MAGDLAAVLTPIVGRIVLNRIGLTGRYDLELAWAPDDPRPTANDVLPPIRMAGRCSPLFRSSLV